MNTSTTNSANMTSTCGCDACPACAAYWRAKADASSRERVRSQDDSDTDGFLSQWASGMCAQEYEQRARVAEQGGTWEFPALFTTAGQRVRAKLIETRYGHSWALCTADGTFTGVFVKHVWEPTARQVANLAKKGYVLGTERVPARVCMRSSGRGLSGNAWIATVRTDRGWPEGV